MPEQFDWFFKKVRFNGNPIGNDNDAVLRRFLANKANSKETNPTTKTPTTTSSTTTTTNPENYSQHQQQEEYSLYDGNGSSHIPSPLCQQILDSQRRIEGALAQIPQMIDSIRMNSKRLADSEVKLHEHGEKIKTNKEQADAEFTSLTSQLASLTSRLCTVESVASALISISTSAAPSSLPTAGNGGSSSRSSAANAGFTLFPSFPNPSAPPPPSSTPGTAPPSGAPKTWAARAGSAVAVAPLSTTPTHSTLPLTRTDPPWAQPPLGTHGPVSLLSSRRYSKLGVFNQSSLNRALLPDPAQSQVQQWNESVEQGTAGIGTMNSGGPIFYSTFNFAANYPSNPGCMRLIIDVSSNRNACPFFAAGMLIWGGTGITKDLASHLEDILFDHVSYLITSLSPNRGAVELYTNGQFVLSDLQDLRHDLQKRSEWTPGTRMPMPQADIAMYALFDALGIPASITIRKQCVKTAETNRNGTPKSTVFPVITLETNEEHPVKMDVIMHSNHCFPLADVNLATGLAIAPTSVVLPHPTAEDLATTGPKTQELEKCVIDQHNVCARRIEKVLSKLSPPKPAMKTAPVVAATSTAPLGGGQGAPKPAPPAGGASKVSPASRSGGGGTHQAGHKGGKPSPAGQDPPKPTPPAGGASKASPASGSRGGGAPSPQGKSSGPVPHASAASEGGMPPLVGGLRPPRTVRTWVGTPVSSFVATPLPVAKTATAPPPQVPLGGSGGGGAPPKGAPQAAGADGRPPLHPTESGGGSASAQLGGGRGASPIWASYTSDNEESLSISPASDSTDTDDGGVTEEDDDTPPQAPKTGGSISSGKTKTGAGQNLLRNISLDLAANGIVWTAAMSRKDFSAQPRENSSIAANPQRPAGSNTTTGSRMTLPPPPTTTTTTTTDARGGGAPSLTPSATAIPSPSATTAKGLLVSPRGSASGGGAVLLESPRASASGGSGSGAKRPAAPLLSMLPKPSTPGIVIPAAKGLSSPPPLPPPDITSTLSAPASLEPVLSAAAISRLETRLTQAPPDLALTAANIGPNKQSAPAGGRATLTRVASLNQRFSGIVEAQLGSQDSSSSTTSSGSSSSAAFSSPPAGDGTSRKRGRPRKTPVADQGSVGAGSTESRGNGGGGGGGPPPTDSGPDELSQE